MATVRSSRGSRALYTSPIPPAPATAMISYGPNREPAANGISCGSILPYRRTGCRPLIRAFAAQRAQIARQRARQATMQKAAGRHTPPMLSLIEFLEEIERHGPSVVIPAPEVERLAERFAPAVRNMGMWNKITDGSLEIPIGNITEAVKTIGNRALADAVAQLRSAGQFAAVLGDSSAAGRLIETLADIHQRQFEQKVEHFHDSRDPPTEAKLRHQVTPEPFGHTA